MSIEFIARKDESAERSNQKLNPAKLPTSITTKDGTVIRKGDIVKVSGNDGFRKIIALVNCVDSSVDYGGDEGKYFSVYRSDKSTGSGYNGSWIVHALRNNVEIIGRLETTVFLDDFVVIPKDYNFRDSINLQILHTKGGVTGKVTYISDGSAYFNSYVNGELYQRDHMIEYDKLVKIGPEKLAKHKWWDGTTQLQSRQINFLPPLMTDYDLKEELRAACSKNSLPENSSAGFVDHIIDVKGDTIRRLGLGSDLRRSVTMVNNGDPVLPEKVLRYIKAACYEEGVSYTLSPPEVQLKSGNQKLTKFLSKKGGDPSPLTRNVLRDHLHATKDILDKADFIARLGEALGNTDHKVTISCNPTDFVTSTVGGGFNSCYSPSGCYFNGNLSYATSPHVAMIYSGTPTKKTGRAWVMFGPNFEWVWVVKSYGIFPVTLRDLGRRAFNILLGGNKHWVKENHKPANKLITISVGYRDNDMFDFSRLRTVKFEECGPIKISETLCLECGTATTHPKGGVCRECATRYICRRCDVRLTSITAVHHDGSSYCQSCYDSVTEMVPCDHCGAGTDQDDRYYIDDNVYCNSDCACEDGWSYCGDCDEWRRSEDFVDDICIHCYSNHEHCAHNHCDGRYIRGNCDVCGHDEGEPFEECVVPGCDGRYDSGNCDVCGHDEGTPADPCEVEGCSGIYDNEVTVRTCDDCGHTIGTPTNPESADEPTPEIEENIYVSDRED